ncbi:MAG: hypothetical protein K9L68_09250, partial [Spirochaetales bacterium]|nr:hypothetical protein [Spirochaetales bacterium]MCF7938771.1 hypothetical protein [Spirochaetales bacterium]
MEKLKRRFFTRSSEKQNDDQPQLFDELGEEHGELQSSPPEETVVKTHTRRTRGRRP